MQKNNKLKFLIEYSYLLYLSLANTINPSEYGNSDIDTQSFMVNHTQVYPYSLRD